MPACWPPAPHKPRASHRALRLPLPAALRSTLTGAAPQGALNDVQLAWRGGLQHPQQYQLRARFEQLAAKLSAGLQLAGSAAVLRKRPDFGLVALGGWVMPVPSNATGTIALGDVLATAPGAGQVSGSLVFTRGTYLTVGLDALWVPKDGLQLVLSEKRRVKFNERHYFDHESFGAIVLVRAPA